MGLVLARKVQVKTVSTVSTVDVLNHFLLNVRSLVMCCSSDVVLLG